MAVRSFGPAAAGDDTAELVATLQASIVAADAATAAAVAAAAAANAAVPPSRLVSAGTGLSGGGSLAADRSFAVAYGTTTGTAAAGNDARLSDARAPMDGSVVTASLATGLVIDGGAL